MIFSVFNDVEYNGVKIADIFHDIGFYYDMVIDNFELEEYDIYTERPEYISYKLYGDPNLYWVLFLTNTVIDPFNDWVVEEEAVHQLTKYRYENTDGYNDIFYHVDDEGRKYYGLVEYPKGSGNWYHEGDTNRNFVQYTGTLVPVTRIEDEIDKNDEKKTIEIIKPNDIDRFLELVNDQIERVKKNGKN
ncbi:MAG: baseplate wedge subunit [Acidobacteria bacterium]|nr:baseplate wedge subunit [Acidobacteriota bacterium]|tara:strand:- start:10083 stop:10649 length:567 start_codon:yes stop_codon:yes gene_type:complete